MTEFVQVEDLGWIVAVKAYIILKAVPLNYLGGAEWKLILNSAVEVRILG